MLSQLLSLLSRPKSPEPSTSPSSKPSASSASSPAPSPASSSNELIDRGVEQIKRHEGLVLNAYQDSLGWWTIGYGRLIDKRKGGGISEAEAEFLLKNDISNVVSSLKRQITFWDRLNAPRQAVLMNMAFQLGVVGLLKFKRTLSLIEAGQFTEAAEGMMTSLWAKQTPRRAQEMANQMRTGKWQTGVK
jgi:lysozyme